MRQLILRLPLMLLLLTACAPPQPVPAREVSAAALYTVRVDQPALVQFSADLTRSSDLPLALPSGCALRTLHPSPDDVWAALELDCSDRPLVQVINAVTGESRVLLPDGMPDSQFLAWDANGQTRPALYLTADTLGRRVVYRAGVDASSFARVTGLPSTTYHMDTTASKMLYAVTRGLGYGSEVWTAGSVLQDQIRVWADAESIATFARWSPDGEHIVFVKMPDSQMAFPPGELWLLDADGGNARRLASADAGHGYAPAWSPDGKRIAFVAAAANLHGNMDVYDLESNALTPITSFPSAILAGPAWSPDGSTLAFDVRTDDTIQVWLYDLAGGKLRALDEGQMCCPFWLSGK